MNIIKHIIRLTGILGLLTGFIGCENVTVGYLMTDNAKYLPDSLVIKTVLDPIEDEYQIKNKIPYQSLSIEGVQGTSPISYSIKTVHPNNSYIDAISQFRIVQKGKIEIPWNHTLAAGRYVVDVEIRNEGYTHVVDSAFTVIVQ